MSAYQMQDRLEQQRWDKHQADMDRDDWISKRADELSNEWPKTLGEFKNPTLELSKYATAMCDQQAVDAYENLVWDVCSAQAAREWAERWMLGEVA